METPTIGMPTGLSIAGAIALLVLGYVFYPTDPVMQFAVWATIFGIYLLWFVVFFSDWMYGVDF